jgi:putative hydrolase
MKYILDLHSHTVASGHAYNTILETVQVAKEKGLAMVGISDHAPTLPGGAHIYYFNNLKVLPKEINGLRVLKGVEANILDETGRIDMSQEDLASIEYVIASMHLPCIPPGSYEKNTETLLNAIKNPLVNIIGHPDDNRYKADYEEAVKVAKEHHVLLEINNTSLNPTGFRQNSRDNTRKILEYSMKYNHPIILGSDAHFCFDIGEFSFAETLMQEVGFPDELVVNTSLHKLEQFLKID